MQYNVWLFKGVNNGNIWTWYGDLSHMGLYLLGLKYQNSISRKVRLLKKSEAIPKPHSYVKAQWHILVDKVWFWINIDTKFVYGL